MRHYPRDKINTMVARAKRKLAIFPTLAGAGVGSTLRGAIENVGQVNSTRSTDQKQNEREGSQLSFRFPASRNVSNANLSGAFPTQLLGMAPSGYAQQQQDARRNEIQKNELIVQQIQREDAINRMTSDEATERAKELRQFFGS